MDPLRRFAAPLNSTEAASRRAFGASAPLDHPIPGQAGWKIVATERAAWPFLLADPELHDVVTRGDDMRLDPAGGMLAALGLAKEVAAAFETGRRRSPRRPALEPGLSIASQTLRR
jgi:hypothetical protein